MLAQQKMHREKVIAAISVTAALVLGLCACSSAQAGSADAAAGTEMLYRESTVTRGDITVGVTEDAVATLKTHSLSFDATAEVATVHVKAGQTVNAGDPIVTFATDELEKELASLQADYQSAALEVSSAQLSLEKQKLDAQNTYETTLNNASTADMSYELTIDELEQAVTEAERAIDKQKRTLSTLNWIWRYGTSDDGDSYTQILDENGNEMTLVGDDGYDYKSEASYDPSIGAQYEGKTEDQLETAIEDAKLEMENLERDLKQAQYNLEIKTSQAELTKEQTEAAANYADTTYNITVQQAQNEIASKQAALTDKQISIAEYQEYIANATLVAPCDGVVTALSAEEGSSVQAGSSVATISDSQNVYVYISVTQDDITGVTIGQECTVEMDAFETATFDGVVDSVTTTPARSASGSASYSVTIKLEGDVAQVYEGMTGSATLITRQQKDVLYVTNRTVIEEDGQSYVKVKHEDGTIEQVPVTTGFSDGRNVEITEGLTEGQTVLIESPVAEQQ